MATSSTSSITQHIFIIYKFEPSAAAIDQPTIEKIYISFLNNGSNTYVAKFEYDQTTGYTEPDKQICIGECNDVNQYNSLKVVPTTTPVLPSVPISVPTTTAIDPKIQPIMDKAIDALKLLLNQPSSSSGRSSSSSNTV